MNTDALPVLSSIDVQGKRVLVRLDTDLPLNSERQIMDDTRLQAALPTLQYLMAQQAKIIVMGHLGRPNGERQLACSLKPVAQQLEKLLKQSVPLLKDCAGSDVEDAVARMKDGDICMLENLRFHLGEQQNSPVFAQCLARLADVYVCEAFANAHRNHASMTGVPAIVPAKAMGLHMQKELDALQKVLHQPEHPFVVIIGGAKISSKIGVLKRFVQLADVIIIGGAMANTFLEAKGYNMQKSLLETDYIDVAREILSTAGVRGCRILLPHGVTTATELRAGAPTFSRAIDEIGKNEMALDVGDRTLEVWEKVIQDAQTILWNGPVGAYEIPPFDKGTQKLAEIIGRCDAFTVVGGGDTLSAIHATDTAHFIDLMSIGGGSLLELIEKGSLPALDALKPQSAAA